MTIQEDAKDYRSQRAYEILYEKKNPTSLELDFLKFLFNDSPKILSMINDKRKKCERILISDILNKEEIDKWKKKKMQS